MNELSNQFFRLRALLLRLDRFKDLRENVMGTIQTKVIKMKQEFSEGTGMVMAAGGMACLLYLRRQRSA